MHTTTARTARAATHGSSLSAPDARRSAASRAADAAPGLPSRKGLAPRRGAPWTRGFAALGLAAWLAACSKPQPPTVTPEVARIAEVTPSDVALSVELRVTNPNSFPVSAQRVTGTLLLDGKTRLGTGESEPGQSIGAGQSALVPAKLRVAFDDLPALVPYIARPKVPYTFDGQVTLGGESLNVTLPFQLQGEVTREQLLAAGLRGLPGVMTQ